MPTVIDSTIDDRTIQLRFDEPLNFATLSEISRQIESLDGVKFTELNYNNTGLTIRLVAQLADPQLVAAVATSIARRTLTTSEPVEIKTALDLDDLGYGLLKTDYRHSDMALLTTLSTQFGLSGTSFEDNGYSISFCVDPESETAIKGLSRKLRVAVNNFYNGVPPKQPLYYVRTDMPTYEEFKLQLNRRVATDQQGSLLKSLAANVEGLGPTYFSDNGHVINGRCANSFFRKNLVAAYVCIELERFFDELDRSQKN